jgi:hypothetical protein
MPEEDVVMMRNASANHHLVRHRRLCQKGDQPG